MNGLAIARTSARVSGSSNASVPDRSGRWTGWSVAAALSGVLLTHHAVHRPLDYGWLVAGALAVLLVGLGWYAAVQRSRLEELRKRIDATPHPADRTSAE